MYGPVPLALDSIHSSRWPAVTPLMWPAFGSVGFFQFFVTYAGETIDPMKVAMSLRNAP